MTGKEISVEKTLHESNAFVQAIHYVSAAGTALEEIVTVEGGISVGSYGRSVIRVSTDNGRTWTETGEWTSEIERRGDWIVRRWDPLRYIEPDHGVQLEFLGYFEEGPQGDYADFGPSQDGTPPQSRTGRIFYRISADDGQTWGAPKQLIQQGGEFDDVHWADGIFYGRNSAFPMPPTRLSDGTVVLPISFNLLGLDGAMITWPDRFGEVKWPVEAAACFIGTWRSDFSDLDWEMSNHVSVREDISRSLTEPAVAEMPDGALMMLMRGSSGPLQTMTGVKFFSTSRNGGKTWGPAVPLTYPDCTYVHSPGALPNLFRSAKNGRVYAIANIRPEPVKHCDPRYPLKIVEIDPRFFWAIPETATVIEDRQPRHPDVVRFSNWRRIEDRETGNPVIYMTEARADDILPGTAGTIVHDSYRYEMILPE